MPEVVTDISQATDFEVAIGRLLIERQRLDERGLERAMRLRANGAQKLPGLLSKLGLVSERDVAEATAQHLGIPLAGARDFPDAPILPELLTQRFLVASLALPLALEPEGLAVAMADPLDDFALEALRQATGRKILPRAGIPGEIESAIERLYGDARTKPDVEVSDPDGASGSELDVERLKDLASEAPVIRLVHQMINKAVEARASDIHIEPFEDRIRVRYRIDGALREVDSLSSRLGAPLVSRIKIMARLNIAERRLPQDGRIKLAVRGTSVDFRIATVPSMHGEGVVIRILDRSTVALDFAALGMRDSQIGTYLGMLEKPDGILLVTGPTGSGKTTTLYASLLRLNSPDKKVISIEDPIEYHLAGINQLQVRPTIGLDFPNILRSVLRYDPDIIMVGEVRDGETAKIAVQAALTGHLVLSTLHTNNAASSVTRLLDMNIEDYLLTSTLNGIVGQRLVRTLCQHCREPYIAMPDLVDDLGLRRFSEDRKPVLFKPKGCPECGGTGFSGRTSIYEMLVITDPIRRLILKRAESNEIHRMAVQQGMRTMFEDGMLKALAGITTFEEVLQVTRDAADLAPVESERPATALATAKSA